MDLKQINLPHIEVVTSPSKDGSQEKIKQALMRYTINTKTDNSIEIHK